MPTTSNFGWTTPADTDLVKDGAAAIRTLGNGIDTSLVDLKGGTSGQYLVKNSNTDLDFTWTTNTADIEGITATSPLTGGGTSGTITVGIQDGTTAQKGAVQLEDSTSSTSTTKAATPNSVKSAYDLANAAIPKSLADAAGDIIYATANDTVARLAIGTAGQVLKVNSGATAPEWGSASASFVGCRAYNVNGQTLTSGTNTAIVLDAEDFDSDGFHSNSTNNTRFTIPTGKGGKYLFTGHGEIENNTTGTRYTILRKNGNTNVDVTTSPGGAGRANVAISAIVDAVAGDYFELVLQQNSGVSLANYGGSPSTWFACQYLGA